MNRAIPTIAAVCLVLVPTLVMEAASPSPASKSSVEPAALAKEIDEAIEARLGSEKTAPGARADDAEFLRRVYLDLTGVIPPVSKAVSFLESRDLRKRERLIDELLASPSYGRHMADIWENLLMVRDSTNRRLKSEPLVDWLANRFNAGTPWNALVRELLTVTGTQEESGAATFFIALRTPDKLNDQVCRLFLGVQLQCAQCHDHPYAPWKRDDYWSMAAFFSKVRAGGRKVGIPAKGIENVNENGVGRKAPLPDSKLDRAPKFLGGERPNIPANQPYRPVLANWLTAPENPFFARAIVNRTWAQFFGRGLVDPVDNVNDFAAASHPPLFEALTREFIASGFDLKLLIRGICTSRAYQRVGDLGGEESGSGRSYARMAVRPLTAEQLYDSLMVVVGSQEQTKGQARKAGKPKDPEKAARKEAKKNGPNSPRARFVAFFDVPDGTGATEYATGIPQVLQLMNGRPMNKNAEFFADLFDSSRTPSQALDRLYLTTLSRYPTKEERARIDAYLKKEKREPREEFADLLWVLLNCSEFTLNH